MIPLRDRNPSGVFPTVTIAIILVNTFVFLYELHLGPAVSNFLKHYALVPAVVTGSIGYNQVTLAETISPFFTSMFLHGGWLHLITNMWFLWIFGDNVEDRLGHFTYLIFYVLCGLGAGLVHAVLNYDMTVPSVGASGAIAGVLGAYVISYP